MNTPETEYGKLLIIGAGSGGYETALLAARKGIEVTLIEKGPVGGTCLNEGCIPTKAFCRHAQMLDELEEAETLGIKNLNYTFDFQTAVDRKEQIVGQLRQGVEGLLRHKLIHCIEGTARFVDAHTVQVNEQTYAADHIIIATGSVPQILPIPGNNLPGVITSREILNLKQIPKRLCVIGAGVIGLEFASIFNSFGSQVTVLEYCKEILPRFDTDLAKRLKQSLGKRGIEIQTQAQVQKIEKAEDGSLKVSFMKKEKEEQTEADYVLMAVGRRANTESLNLDDIGIAYNKRGIEVDENMQTSLPHIYAIGDINGRQMLAHAATFQGVRALNHILGENDSLDLNIIPAAVFTQPEAATVGLTEEDCKAQNIPYRCHKSFFRANGKAVCLNETDGFCKLLSHKENGKILGGHLFGPHAADLIQEITVLIQRQATIGELSNIVHAHPTLGEVILEASKD